MTNNEIKDTLKKASKLVNTMDKNHVKVLLRILVDALAKRSSASFLFIDMKKTVKKLLNDIICTEHVNLFLSRKHMKQIMVIIKCILFVNCVENL